MLKKLKYKIACYYKIPRGMSLPTVLALLGLLTIISFATFTFLSSGMKIQSADAAANKALMAADAGFHYGMDELEFALGIDESNPGIAVDGLPLFTGNAACDATNGCKILNWHLIGNEVVNFDDNSYFIVVGKDTGRNTLLIRSFGFTSWNYEASTPEIQSKRLLEFEIGGNGS